MRYGKFVNAVYIINVIVQSFFSLACPMGLGFLSAWLLVEKAGAPAFLYAVLIVLGALVGIYSMIKFIIDTMTAVERLEKQREKRKQESKADKNQRDGKNEEKL
ncbi:MAG: AtpZ/AtpI family protein [Clostridia bacterium]|nr:AtpZ/AtpI family protein [Clostridia bacterium]